MSFQLVTQLTDISLTTLPRDRWGVQGMNVEIADKRFGLQPEYSEDNAGMVSSKDGLDCAVKWPKAQLNTLVGKTGRLHIHLKKGDHAEPRFYAAYVSCD